MFEASTHVTHRECADNIAAQRLHLRYPDIERVGFAELIAAGELPALRRRPRRETTDPLLGYPGFKLFEPVLSDHAAVVTYSSPAGGPGSPVGLDVLADGGEMVQVLSLRAAEPAERAAERRAALA